MPLFTRRRLQSMLDHIAPHLDAEKCRDLLARLENKRVDQVLPAEVELVLLWALSNIGEIDVEPVWWGDEKRPDAYTEALVPGEPAVIEIAAPNDNAISGEEAMDGVALRISQFANSISRGIGNYLYFRFRVESGYEDGTYYRRRLAPLNYELSKEVQERVRNWIQSGKQETHRLRISEADLDVEVEKSKHKQIRFHNTWSSMPPETYSLGENPLYKLLVRKLDQLRAARPGTHRFIFLGDAGSTLLRRIGQIGESDPTRRRVSGMEILSYFVSAHQMQIDSVVVFAPVRHTSPMGREALRWTVSVFNRPGFEFDDRGLRRLVANLPRPRFEGYQTRSLFRQGLFSLKAPGWWLGMTIEVKRGGPMQAKFSSRAFMDLLAGRISSQQFRQALGDRPNEQSIFEIWLNSGLTIQNVEFESGGVDEDDDLITITLSDDPAARPLNLDVL